MTDKDQGVTRITVMVQKPTVVHVTHEATGKIGGIGAVLEGMFTSPAYNDEVARTILVSPLFSTEGGISGRLGPGGEVLYSSLDGLIRSSYVSGFRRIEDAFNVEIIYGRRRFTDPMNGITSQPEILLIDVSRMEKGPIDHFKGEIFREFGIRSDRYEHFWDYEQWVRLALPAIEALKTIGAAEQDKPTIVVAHEFMGMPTALGAILDPYDFKTVFYAHEVAPMRRIVEEHPGHDTMFYNVIRKAHQRDLYVNEVFGDQSYFFKYALVNAARYCDNILAVGDCVVDELKFLAPEFGTADIDLTYNGIPAYAITVAEKHESREKLRQYCRNLLGWKPDFIFTHVTRLVMSKGLWRDLRVLEHMDREFDALGRTGVLLVLSTETHRRRQQDICRMEAAYNWPVAHREGMPDLSGGEAAYYVGVQEFNARSRNIKVVFINQFGFDQQSCGNRMPSDMQFMDIRKGSDVEFGQSIYEPFGIAQLEPLTFGGICVLTNVCGCAGFAKAVAGSEIIPNVIFVDYTELNGDA
ncbi:MAG: glycosyltransferase, partial [Planctomycetales bacterium]|nr:glycosyltransferase [Planctomycetales bacterium]